MLNRTIVLDYELIETGVHSRTSLFSDTVGTLINTALTNQRLVLPANSSTIFNNITQFLYIRSTDAIQLQLVFPNGDSAPFFNVDSMFYSTSAFLQVVIENTSTTDLNCIVLFA